MLQTNFKLLSLRPSAYFLLRTLFEKVLLITQLSGTKSKCLFMFIKTNGKNYKKNMLTCFWLAQCWLAPRNQKGVTQCLKQVILTL